MSNAISANPPMTGLRATLDRLLTTVSRLLDRYSVDVLRVSLGLVFLIFGALKLAPGVSPAAGLAVATIEKLTIGIINGGGALMLTAVMEVLIGLTLVTGRFVKVGLVLLAIALVGILSPLVLFGQEMFPGPGPSLTAQYVFKDIVLASAGLVVAAKALRPKVQS